MCRSCLFTYAHKHPSPSLYALLSVSVQDCRKLSTTAMVTFEKQNKTAQTSAPEAGGGGELLAASYPAAWARGAAATPPDPQPRQREPDPPKKIQRRGAGCARGCCQLLRKDGGTPVVTAGPFSPPPHPSAPLRPAAPPVPTCPVRPGAGCRRRVPAAAAPGEGRSV